MLKELIDLVGGRPVFEKVCLWSGVFIFYLALVGYIVYAG